MSGAIVYFGASLSLLDSEPLENDLAFLELFVLQLGEIVATRIRRAWFDTLVLSLVVAFKGCRVRIWDTFKELGIDGGESRSTVLSVLPKLDHFAELAFDGFHLRLCVHVVWATQAGGSIFELVRWMLLEPWLSHLLNASFNNCSLDRIYVEKEA